MAKKDPERERLLRAIKVQLDRLGLTYMESRRYAVYTIDSSIWTLEDALKALSKVPVKEIPEP